MQLLKDVLDPSTRLLEVLLGRRTGKADSAGLPDGKRDRRSRGSDCTTATNRVDTPGFKTWREVGWIFRDGDCIAIERLGEEIRSRVLVD